MRTQRLLEAIAADLSDQLPQLCTCQVHDGRWDVEEVQRWSRSTPALFVTWLGTRSTAQPGERWTDADHMIGAFVMTADSGKLPRGEAARNLVDWLLLYIPRARWGITSGIGAAENIRAENAYSARLDRRRLAIWLVTWVQTLRLETGDEAACPPLPRELYSSAQEDPQERLAPEAA